MSKYFDEYLMNCHNIRFKSFNLKALSLMSKFLSQLTATFCPLYRENRILLSKGLNSMSPIESKICSYIDTYIPKKSQFKVVECIYH